MANVKIPLHDKNAIIIVRRYSHRVANNIIKHNLTAANDSRFTYLYELIILFIKRIICTTVTYYIKIKSIILKKNRINILKSVHK